MKQALIVIDVQNDYFPDGRFPLWNVEPTLEVIERAIARAREKGIDVVLVQHVARAEMAPFFKEGSHGAALHPRILAAVPDAPVVVKAFADSFHQTNLEQTLQSIGATDLLVCGMMTQNCVTHTAISKSAEKYAVTMLMDACTTVNEMLHRIALNAVSTRLSLKNVDEVL